MKKFYNCTIIYNYINDIIKKINFFSINFFLQSNIQSNIINN